MASISGIDQKEYLKRYLSLGDQKEKNKKRKKKSKMLQNRIKIIDDDIDVPHEFKENELNEFLTAEDAPQVVGMVDDRPMSMRIDDYRKSEKWKFVGFDEESEKKSRKSISTVTNSPADSSPPRKSKTSNEGKVRKSRFSDITPPREQDKPETELSSRKAYDSDASPPRRRTELQNDSDASPPRKRRTLLNADESPPRKRRTQSDSDNSPRRQKNSEGTDNRPPRKHTKNMEDTNRRPPTKYKEQDKNQSRNTDRKRDKHSAEPKKMTKTLDGKTAGLQSGRDLKQESATIRKREDELFKNMSAEISGKDAAPIMRDRKTGKKRDLEKEAIAEFEKQQVENVKKEKYDKWGKGLKQVEDQKQKVEQEIYEMSKPLARYADDKDLEQYLRDQEREGDPMLQYIRKKKRKDAETSGNPVNLKPQYDGEFMPNRYGIPPGHRWDGVDRSSGYEQEWFKIQNSKKAVQEEVYKWSTEDM